MSTGRIVAAVERLDRVLALRIRQRALSPALRRAHQDLLRFFLGEGRPPLPTDAWTKDPDPVDAALALREAGLVVTDDDGAITGAYPFTTERREHLVVTRHGEVNAMCAIDALGVAPMFGVSAVVVSRCRLSGTALRIEQARDGAASSDRPVFAAVDWTAVRPGATCAESLCTRMMFVTGDAGAWRMQDPAERDVFDLDEATAFAAALFVPLMR